MSPVLPTKPVGWPFLKHTLRSAIPNAALVLFTAVFAVLADEPKEKTETKKPAPPKVPVALPLAITGGVTNKILLRGLNLTNATEVRFTNSAAQPDVAIRSRAKVEVPKEQDAKKVGDTQLGLEARFPDQPCVLTNYFVVITPEGQSDPQPMLIFPAGSLIEEKEPNGSFRQAQTIEMGKTIRGIVKEAGDVNVFRFEGTAG